jgi:hypothetical protein
MLAVLDALLRADPVQVEYANKAVEAAGYVVAFSVPSYEWTKSCEACELELTPTVSPWD